jgi:hypothetical protein
MIKILNSSLTRLGALKNVLSANRLEILNSENTLDFSATLDGHVAEFVDEDSIYELDDEYFDTAMLTKAANEDGTFTIAVEAEHISYRLNDPTYNVQWFTEIGLPSYILGKVLEGTGFTVGTVEFTTSITYSAQEAKSRRQLLMELVAYLEGEISFNKFEVSILTHRGSTEVTSVIKDRNIKVVSKTVNKRQKDKDGNDLVSYICTPIFVPGDSYTLGDDVALLQKPLGLSERLRIISISRNPYDEMQTTLEFANYTNGLESALFRIETNTIAKGKLYYGARISPELGFESIRSDLKARTVMNADTFEMQVGDGTGLWYKKLWFDPELGLYIFDGTLSADTIEAVKAEIDIVVTNVTITNVLSANKAVISELTVDELDTNDKVPNYKKNDKSPDGYIHIFDEHLNFIDAQYKGDAVAPGAEPAIVTQAWPDGYPGTGLPALSLGEERVFLTPTGLSFRMYRFVGYSGKIHFNGQRFVPTASSSATWERFEFNEGTQTWSRTQGPSVASSNQFSTVTTIASWDWLPFDVYTGTDAAATIATPANVRMFQQWRNEYIRQTTFSLIAYPNQFIWEDTTGAQFLFAIKHPDGKPPRVYLDGAQWYVEKLAVESYRRAAYNAAQFEFNTTTGTAGTGSNATFPLNNFSKIVWSNCNICSDTERTVVTFTANTADGGGAIVAKEQVRNRDGSLMYWIDAEHSAPTMDSVDKDGNPLDPIWQYEYEELLKMTLYLEWNSISSTFDPVFIMGAGTGTGNNGKAIMRKGVSGWSVTYYATGSGLRAAGEPVSIGLDNDGWTVTPFELEKIQFSTTGFSTTYSGKKYDWEWEKDVNGKITKLIQDGREIPVTW